MSSAALECKACADERLWVIRFAEMFIVVLQKRRGEQHADKVQALGVECQALSDEQREAHSAVSRLKGLLNKKQRELASKKKDVDFFRGTIEDLKQRDTNTQVHNFNLASLLQDNHDRRMASFSLQDCQTFLRDVKLVHRQQYVSFPVSVQGHSLQNLLHIHASDVYNCCKPSEAGHLAKARVLDLPQNTGKHVGVLQTEAEKLTHALAQKLTEAEAAGCGISQAQEVLPHSTIRPDYTLRCMTPVLLHSTLGTMNHDCRSLFLLTRSSAVASSEGHCVSQEWLICGDVCPECPLNKQSHPGWPFAFIDNQEGRLICTNC